jgi:hypothetical protein
VDPNTEFVEVARAGFVQATGMRAFLEDSGISCYLNPSVPGFPPCEDHHLLMCPATEAERARELIAAYFAAAPVPAPPDGDD